LFIGFTLDSSGQQKLEFNYKTPKVQQNNNNNNNNNNTTLETEKKPKSNETLKQKLNFSSFKSFVKYLVLASF